LGWGSSPNSVEDYISWIKTKKGEGLYQNVDWDCCNLVGFVEHPQHSLSLRRVLVLFTTLPSFYNNAWAILWEKDNAGSVPGDCREMQGSGAETEISNWVIV
jgi:hypothetical protein